MQEVRFELSVKRQETLGSNTFRARKRVYKPEFWETQKKVCYTYCYTEIMHLIWFLIWYIYIYTLNFPLANGRGKLCGWFTNNAHIKEHRRSRIISIMTSAIYQEQRKLLPALKENATVFHIPICSSFNLDELICTSPVSVRALNRSSARHHYASV